MASSRWDRTPCTTTFLEPSIRGPRTIGGGQSIEHTEISLAFNGSCPPTTPSVGSKNDETPSSRRSPERVRRDLLGAQQEARRGPLRVRTQDRDRIHAVRRPRKAVGLA